MSIEELQAANSELTRKTASQEEDKRRRNRELHALRTTQQRLQSNYDNLVAASDETVASTSRRYETF